MKTIRVFGVAFALLLVLVLAVVPAYAQSYGGSNAGGNNGSAMSANNAANASGACISSMGAGNFTGVNNWQTLCGQSAVFAFDYDGSNNPVTIEMATNPSNSASFFVYTPSQFLKGVNQTNPYNGGGSTSSPQYVSTLGTPIGAGTQQPFGSPNSNGTQNYRNNGNFLWTGASPEHGTFYVLVQPRAMQNTAFWINATGSGLSGFRFMPAGVQTQLAMTGGNAATSSPGTTGTTAAMAQAGIGGRGNGAGGPPLTLPRTGGEFEALQLLAAGAALVSAGLFVRRRK